MKEVFEMSDSLNEVLSAVFLFGLVAIAFFCAYAQSATERKKSGKRTHVLTMYLVWLVCLAGYIVCAAEGNVFFNDIGNYFVLGIPFIFGSLTLIYKYSID